MAYRSAESGPNPIEQYGTLFSALWLIFIAIIGVGGLVASGEVDKHSSLFHVWLVGLFPALLVLPAIEESPSEAGADPSTIRGLATIMAVCTLGAAYIAFGAITAGAGAFLGVFLVGLGPMVLCWLAVAVGLRFQTKRRHGANRD